MPERFTTGGSPFSLYEHHDWPRPWHAPARWLVWPTWRRDDKPRCECGREARVASAREGSHGGRYACPEHGRDRAIGTSYAAIIGEQAWGNGPDILRDVDPLHPFRRAAHRPLYSWAAWLWVPDPLGGSDDLWSTSSGGSPLEWATRRAIEEARGLEAERDRWRERLDADDPAAWEELRASRA